MNGECETCGLTVRPCLCRPRPGPEQVLPAGAVETLTHYGYVIVHPDDYPRAEYGNVMNTTQIGFAAGVNVCLDRIFAAEQETPT